MNMIVDVFLIYMQYIVNKRCMGQVQSNQSRSFKIKVKDRGLTIFFIFSQ